MRIPVYSDDVDNLRKLVHYLENFEDEEIEMDESTKEAYDELMWLAAKTVDKMELFTLKGGC